MSNKLRFLVDANPEHGYNVIEVSSDFTKFVKKEIKISDTKIRINKGIFAEDLDNKEVLSEDNIRLFVSLINDYRSKRGLKGRFQLVEETTLYNGDSYNVIRVKFMMEGL